MPLLVRTAQTPDDPAPPTPGGGTHITHVMWTSPDGDELDLMRILDDPPILLRPGVDGFGAAPREVARQALASGGGFGRWSHAAERTITLPMALHHPDPDAFLQLRRRVTRAFTATTPPAGTPRPGRLRVTRSDGSWREIAAVYLDGLGWADADGIGATDDLPVVELVAPDPWWQSGEQFTLQFGIPEPRNYLDPYETVSAGRGLGSQTVTIVGEIPAAPVWTIHGPAESVTVRYADAGPGWTFGAVDEDETITIDVGAATVTDQDGTNRVGDLAWPTSSLFRLPPGDTDLLLSMDGGEPGRSAIVLTYRPRWETA